MFEDVKAAVIGYMPTSDQQPPSQMGWGRVLLYMVALTAFEAAYRGAALTLLVWVIRRYWWHDLPSLGYLPAMGIMLLASFVFGRLRSRSGRQR